MGVKLISQPDRGTSVGRWEFGSSQEEGPGRIGISGVWVAATLCALLRGGRDGIWTGKQSGDDLFALLGALVQKSNLLGHAVSLLGKESRCSQTSGSFSRHAGLEHSGKGGSH